MTDAEWRSPLDRDWARRMRGARTECVRCAYGAQRVASVFRQNTIAAVAEARRSHKETE